MTTRRDGMVLLEVMLGTLILVISGIALVTLLTQTVETIRHGRLTERHTLSAAKVLNRTTLLSDAELALRIGRQRVGDWNVDINAPTPELFTIDVRDTLSNALMLGTMVYRSTASGNAH
jgi:hypothetical protein